MSWNALALRLALVVIAIIAIWFGVIALFDGAGGSYTGTRLLQGALISAAAVALVSLMLRLDRLHWHGIIHRSACANARAFALGTGLWLLPALLGGALCVAMGWTTITPLSAPSTLLAALLPLAMAVFLTEAFPEELVVRGYIQGLLARRTAQWIALLLQAVMFIVFAWAIGAMDSLLQWMFLPGFALILGYARAVTGNVWTSIGVHTAWMTTAQLMSPSHGHVTVEGMQALQFIAFALLPSATLGAALPLLDPSFDWRRRLP